MDFGTNKTPIKDKGAKFNDYSISPKINQILLHWGYEIIFLLVYKNELLFVQ